MPVNLKKVETDVGIALAGVEKNIHPLARCLLSIIAYDISNLLHLRRSVHPSCFVVG